MQQYLSASEVWVRTATTSQSRRLVNTLLPRSAGTLCSLHFSLGSFGYGSQAHLGSLTGSLSSVTSRGQKMAAVKPTRRPSSASPVVAFGSQAELSSSPRSRLSADPHSSLPIRQSSLHSEEVWDVTGLGQGMVDFSAQVDDALLERLDVVKGSRRSAGV